MSVKVIERVLNNSKCSSGSKPSSPILSLNYGWVVAFAGFFMHLALGTMYCWGTFTPYITSYLRKFDPSITYNDTILALLAAPAAQTIGFPIGGMIEQKLGPRITSLLGSWIMCLGVFLSAFATSVSSLVFFYGVIYGLGMGIAYMCPLKCGYRWMPKRKGIISGIVVTGFGLGGAAFNIVGATICNPENKTGTPYFEDDVASRVPTMLMILGGIYAVCTTLGAMVLVDPTESDIRELRLEASYGCGQREEPQDEEMQQPLKPKLHPSSPIDSSSLSSISGKPKGGMYETLMDPRAALLFAMMGLTTSSGLLVVGTYKTVGTSSGVSDQVLTLVGSLSLCFNGLGRILYGSLCDNIGFKTSLIIDFFSQFVIGLLFMMTTSMPVAFTVVVCLMVMNYGGNFSMYPTVTAEMFGTESVASNYGFVFAGFATSSILLKICK
mmetsp:Transcript_27636/g.44532  ORF Transcript_27636/g.44532 Transcript_27636/m.44532 type:complete len:439 (-) Transcript_27636:108-1424(-)